MQISLLETDTQKQLPEQVKGKLSKTANDGWVSFSIYVANLGQK